MAPASEEVKQGRPFAPNTKGRPNAAKVLEAIVKDLGLERESFSITNLIRCRPKGDKWELGGASAVRACSAALQAELALARPPLIITLGAEPLRALVKTRSKLSELRGQVLESEQGKILPTYHPAAMLHTHNPQIQDDIFEDMKSLFVSAGGSRKIKPALFSLERKKLPRQAIIDIELSKETGEIRCLGFSPGLKGGSWIRIAEKPVSFQGSKELIGHFVKSDFVELRRQGWIDESWKGKLIDTILLVQLEDQNRESYGLKSFSSEYGFPIYWEEVRDAWRRGADPPRTQLLPYNASDVALTRALYQDYRGRLDRDQRKARYFDRFLVDGLRLCAEVELNGAAVSPAIVKVIPSFERRIAYRERWLRRKLQVSPEQNLNATLFKRSLFKRLELKPIRFTPKQKAPSFDKHTLALLVRKDRTGVLRRYQELGKLKTQYQMAEKLVPFAGELVHPSFNLGGVGEKDWKKEGGRSPITGRLSSEDPNLQQQPDWIRRYFVSRFPDGVILSADAKQIELKTAYCYSKDSAFLKPGRHELTRKLLASSFLTRRWKYADGKTANFAAIFGADPGGLELGLSLEQGQGKILRNLLRQEFMTHFHWVEETHRQARATGKVSSLTGREWYIPGAQEGNHHALNQVINYPIQNLASDLVLLVGILLGWKPMGCVLWNLVHDELVFDCPDRERAKILAENLSETVKRQLPLEVEKRWGVTLPLELEFDLRWGKNWLDLEPVPC